MKNVVVAVVHREEIPEKPSKYTQKSTEIITGMIEECFSLAGGIERFIKPNQTVLLKPNIVGATADPDSGVNTDPRVIEATVKYIKNSVKNVRVLVGETPYGERGVSRKALDVGTPIGDAVRRAGGEVVYFDEEPRIRVNLPKAKTFWEFTVPQVLMECDVYIQMPKLKQHAIAQVSHSLKNIMGFLTHEDMISCHNTSLFQQIVDINKARMPDFTIMDGLLSLTYDHYTNYEEHKVKFNTLIAGEDAVAVDAVSQYLMGWNDPAKEVKLTRIAQHDGLGVADLEKIEIKGEDVRKLRKNLITPWDPQTRKGFCAYSYEPTPIEAVYDGVEVFMGGCCSGCQALIRESLDWANFDGTLKRIIEDVGNLNIIVGRNARINPSLLPLVGATIVYGDCASYWAKEVGRWVDRPTCFALGCPPDFGALSAFFSRILTQR
ncbi:MAG: DUF362 domain-containing protein [Candidatus Bathyarchaeia archaeon]